ncbi:translation initiation factor IF-2-like [Mustela putorius furo]|uniref:Translation initiation factor IF-2-like n=1 Tax=Mustela putorius furo TaxID=9669 RepID=A0A8U0SNB1_MUSPF|nr:translation initiation factor IF-2-like [Mustela putorius furo]
MTSPWLHRTAAPRVPSARGELGVGNGQAGERPRTNTRRRPPARPGGIRGRRTAQMALAARWMLQSRHHSPLSTASPGQDAARAHSWESGLGRGSSGSAPNPSGPAPASPSLRRLGGAPGPRGSAPVGPTKPPESPLLAAFAVSPVPPDYPSSPPGRREWRSPRPGVPAIGAGVSTSEQSPRPDVSAGTRTRTRRCAPARHLRSSSCPHRGVAPRALRVPARQPAGPSSQAQGGPDHPGTPGRASRKTRARMQKLAIDRRRESGAGLPSGRALCGSPDPRPSDNTADPRTLLRSSRRPRAGLSVTAGRALSYSRSSAAPTAAEPPEPWSADVVRSRQSCSLPPPRTVPCAARLGLRLRRASVRDPGEAGLAPRRRAPPPLPPLRPRPAPSSSSSQLAFASYPRPALLPGVPRPSPTGPATPAPAAAAAAANGLRPPAPRGLGGPLTWDSAPPPTHVTLRECSAAVVGVAGAEGGSVPGTRVAGIWLQKTFQKTAGF